MRVLELRAVNLDHRARGRQIGFSAAASTMRVFPEPVGPETEDCPPGVPANSAPRKRPGTYRLETARLLLDPRLGAQ